MNQYYTPPEIVAATVEKGIEKGRGSLQKLLILSFLGGMYIALGFLACLRIASSLPAEWGGFGSFLGACIFPVGLVAVLLAGGELITGNMLVVAVARFRGAITTGEMLRNWVIVTLGNLLGAMATAFFLVQLAGLMEGALLSKILATAAGKLDATFAQAFFSGIGCNIFVGLGVWLSFGAKDFAGKILAIWFPVTAFVAIGFQHVVANMFVIPAAIFSGESALTWLDFLSNAVPVWLGNAAGGAIVLGLSYCLAYAKPKAEKAPAPITQAEKEKQDSTLSATHPC